MTSEREIPFYVMTTGIEAAYLTWLRWYQVEATVVDSGVLRQAYLGGRLDTLEGATSATARADRAESRVRALEAALADLIAAFTLHREATHKVKPNYCETCQEGTAALTQARGILAAAPDAAGPSATHRK